MSKSLTVAPEDEIKTLSSLGLRLVQLLRITAVLWLGYFLILFAIDQSFVRTQPDTIVQKMFLNRPNGVPPLPSLYYLFHCLVALSVLGLTFWQWAQDQLKHTFLPLVIVLMSVPPTLITSLVGPTLPPGPMTSAEGLELRLLPVLLMALILVAWQYRWLHVVLFSIATALLHVVGILARLPAGPASIPGMMVTLIQTISFLVVGYCVCAIMSRLREQTASLTQANLQLRHYNSTLEQLAVSHERNRVARELHDTLAHTLSGLTVQMETIKAYWDVDPATARTLQATALDVARNGLQETRRALKALRATPLDDLGLSLALRSLVESKCAPINLPFRLTITDPLPILSPDVEQCLYRVAQEAIANVIQHAQASLLTVSLTVQNSQLILLIQDDGKGFEPPMQAQTGHFGLDGIRERVQLVGGQFSIAHKLGMGTTVQVILNEVVRP